MAFAKFLFVLSCVVVAVVATPTQMGQLVGGKTPLTGESLREAEEVLKNALIERTDENSCTYHIEKIYNATSQIVAGVLYNFNADLKHCDQLQNCNVSVLLKRWLNSTEVEFNCEDKSS